MKKKCNHLAIADQTSQKNWSRFGLRFFRYSFLLVWVSHGFLTHIGLPSYTSCHCYHKLQWRCLCFGVWFVNQMAMSINLQTLAQLWHWIYRVPSKCFVLHVLVLLLFFHLAVLHCLNHANPTWNYSSASRKMNHEAPYFKPKHSLHVGVVVTHDAIPNTHPKSH